MTDQFRMTEAPSQPQTVRVAWEMETPDDTTADRPDERDDGFWPVPDDYDTGEAYDAAHSDAADRMAAWERGDWWFVGVVAVATVYVPVGQGSFATYTLRSPGVWGVESDWADHLAELYAEERAELTAHLATIGAHFAALAKGEG